MSLILKLNDLIEGEVIKRPSKYIKTPYVADIKISSTSDMILGHTASLGCCGLADVGANILISSSKINLYLSSKRVLKSDLAC